jgi:D-alanyl-D-alanine carboxypeptidase/D-alanyl-D-alanine-endopeptidase (penicillin-binding protein 4)
MFRRHVLTIVSTALMIAWAPAHAQSALPDPVLRALRATTIPADALSVLVLRDDKTVLAHLADRPMNPASTMKLATTLIGLELLGPTFRGRTELRTTAALQGDVLNGDLYLRGGADPDFSTEALTTMLRALRYAGIRTIAGHLVVDRGLFNPARPDLGAAPFDEYPEAYYNVIPDALLVNKNMLQLDIRSVGGRIRVAMQPELDGVSVDTDMKLVNADCATWEDGWKTPTAVAQPDGGIRLMLHGTFPQNCVASNAVNVIDRQAYVDRLVRRVWSTLGGSIADSTVEGATPPDARLLAEHVARTLPEIVRDTNKPSDNALARTIFLSLGALEADAVLGSHPQTGGGFGAPVTVASTTAATAATTAAANAAVAAPAAANAITTTNATTNAAAASSATPVTTMTATVTTQPTTFARADAAIRGWLRAHGIADTGLVLENGAGLSRTERITPVQLGGVLQAGLRSDWAPEFLASIPIVAVDGTMRRRLHDSPAAGRARMKTGTLNGVVAVAGYVPDASGRRCVLVAMINSDRVSNGRGRIVLDALVDWLARSNGLEQPLPAIGTSTGTSTNASIDAATHARTDVAAASGTVDGSIVPAK